MKVYGCIVMFVVSSILCGCSGVMRPPSAAAFMSSYNENKSVSALTASLYRGDLVSESEKVSDDIEIESKEWFWDISYEYFINVLDFSLGLGIQTFTPMIQPGFVSKHFGFMGWSNIPMNRIDLGNGKTAIGWMGGFSAIQQLVFNSGVRIGLTEHISKNGFESRKKDRFCGEGFGPTGACNGTPSPKVYTEMGAGAYITYGYVSFEFRYGRDISEDRNRFTFSLDFMFFMKKVFDYREL